MFAKRVSYGVPFVLSTFNCIITTTGTHVTANESLYGEFKNPLSRGSTLKATSEIAGAVADEVYGNENGNFIFSRNDDD